MASSSLHFFFLALLLPLTLTTATRDTCATAAPDGSDDLSIIPVNARCSPFAANPTSTSVMDTVLHMASADSHRLAYLSSLVADKPNRTSVPVASANQLLHTGNYVVRARLGTPPQLMFMVLDTSNDAVWLPCSGCSGCSTAATAAYFNPNSSSTYSTVSCSAAQCTQARGLTCPSSSPSPPSSVCSFNQSYGGGSSFSASLVQDTLTLASDVISNFSFGCINSASGNSLPPQGLMGLGRGPTSLISQTTSLYSGVFSYCLPSFRSFYFSGSLKLGPMGQPRSIRYTPLLRSAHRPSLYYAMAMDGSDFFQDDCDSIAAEMKDQEERIQLKRRWLLGLYTPKPENPTTEFLESEDHTPEKTEFLESEYLPESLLREDDLFYETAKSRVEEAFGFCKNQEAQRKESMFCTKDVVRRLSMYLDSLTNEGLSLVVKIITGGSSSFDKTRPKMKQIIRESVRTDLRERGRDDIVEQLHQALSDSENFRKDSAKPMFPSHRDAALKALAELDKLSTQTLLAMKRKLEGSVTIPRLKPSKMGGNKMDLIDQVKQASEKMLSELSSGDKLQEPLAKAMSLVDLSLKLSPGYNKTRPPTDFFHFSPETKKLQMEIVKAVWSLRTARIDAAFERVGLILDPEAQISKNRLRSAVERMLFEYLFECCDMDVIPKSLTNALSLVNKSTRTVDHRVFPGEAVEEETECILNVSAQVKQIAWQCIPDYELDQDFGDAYMEELEDSDDDYSQDDAIDTSDPVQDEVGAECSVLNSNVSSDETSPHHISSSLVIRDLTESITRARPMSLFATPTSSKFTPVRDNQISPRSLYSVENIKSDDRGAQNPIKRKKNQYLAVQEICDDTSLVTYNLIGRLLEKFADQKGLDLKVDQRSYLRGESRLQEDVEGEEKQALEIQGKLDESITLSAVQEIIPSLDKSVLLKLKELLE